MRSGWEACGDASWRGPCQYKSLSGWLSTAKSLEQFHFLKCCCVLQRCWWVLLPGLKALAVHSKVTGIKLTVVSEIVSEGSDRTSGEWGKVRRLVSVSGEKGVIL